MDKDNFCILPWSSVTINTDGKYRVCGFSGNGIPVKKDIDGIHEVADHDKGYIDNKSIFTDPIDEILNSDFLKEIRLSQINNQKHNNCRVCWDRDAAAKKENQSTNSCRVARSFYEIPKYDILNKTVRYETAKSLIKEDGSISTPLINLELKFDNLCNYKCIYCQPVYSNLWYEDWIKLENTNKFPLGLNYGTITKDEHGRYKSECDSLKWGESDIWWKQFDKIKENLQYIYVLGGESFLSKAHDKMLDNLIKSDLAKNIVLEYDTNLSIMNYKIIDKFKHFRKIHIRISCDDIYDRYELIRFPGNFDRFLKNLSLLEDAKLSNLDPLMFTTCVGIYSIFSPIRLYEFFVNRGYKMGTRILNYPWEYDIAYLSKKIKNKILNVYEKSSIDSYNRALVIGYIKNNYDKHTDEESEKQIILFKKRMDKLDEIRKTNWKKTFPEIVRLLDINE